MKKLLFAVALAAAVVFPTTALAGTFTGVVVGKGGGNLAVAAKGGGVRTVHSSAHVRIGARVHVNGTTVRAFGMARSARVHGVIVRRVNRITFLAAGRSLIALRARSGRTLAGRAPSMGAIVNTNVAIAGGQLTQQSMQVVGHDNKVTIQAPVTAVGPGTVTVIVNGQPLTIQLPAGIQLPASLIGQSVTITVDLKADDENETEIEDEDQAEQEDNDAADDDDQGEDADNDNSGPGGGDHGGSGGDDGD